MYKRLKVIETTNLENQYINQSISFFNYLSLVVECFKLENLVN